MNGTEEGKYILIPASSYLPERGVDGFGFGPDPRSRDIHALGKWIFDFKRTPTRLGTPGESLE
jgi:hypothetical protein